MSSCCKQKNIIIQYDAKSETKKDERRKLSVRCISTSSYAPILQRRIITSQERSCPPIERINDSSYREIRWPTKEKKPGQMSSPLAVSDKESTKNATPDNTEENARSSVHQFSLTLVQRAKKKKGLASDKAEIKRYSTR